MRHGHGVARGIWAQQTGYFAGGVGLCVPGEAGVPGAGLAPAGGTVDGVPGGFGGGVEVLAEVPPAPPGALCAAFGSGSG